jgi:uncharacterized membrane protein (DUF106 family)
MVFVNPLVDIAFISFGLSVLVQALQRVLGSKQAMQKHQTGMKEKQEKMKVLMKNTDKQSQKELEKLQGEMLESMNDMMKGSMKMMVASMILFIPALWFLQGTYDGAVIALPVPMPWFVQGFDVLNIGSWGIEFYKQTNWLGWYFVTSLAFSLLIVGPLAGLFDKWRQKNAQSA